MEADKNPLPEIRIIEVRKWLCRAGRAVLGVFEMHQLASHGDNFNHPLDTPPQPVTEWPLESDGISHEKSVS